MTTSLMSGLEIIVVISLMTVALCPVLVWVLPNRRGALP